ncbi:MAG: TraB family protein [Deltaproteobacteria bacterium HGW-Deltaproteobacteria-21]|nr:MAG: TraB family protein [Deltaproteobacteria bacterium HGW-Deltaproteobacteria-21]
MDESSDIHRLQIDGKEVILVGTAHVSTASVDLVEKVIQDERPDTVCVELCKARFESLTQKQKWQDTDLYRVVKDKKVMVLLSNLLLAYFQKKIGSKLGIRPGAEIIRAIECAGAVGAGILLADRDIRTTLSRVWRLMGFVTRFRLLFHFIGSVADSEAITEAEIEEMKKTDVLESLLTEVGKTFPQVRMVLIDERDQYLTEMIRTAPGEKILAVVGAGHVPGIKNNWQKEVDMEALRSLPPKGRFSSVMKWAIPGLIIGIFVFGFLFPGREAAANMITSWVLATGIMAGLGAVAAFAHPLTILSAILSAPLTTLHPLIAAGWVAGLVEAVVVKPKVKDFEKLIDDISGLKGFWRNKITRILLVVVFTNLGATIGTLVAIPLLLRFLK